MLRALFCALWLAPAASACETALVLAMDVSNSVDAAEYRLQAHGLADALLDPEITEVLVRDRIALAVMQWAGPDKQELSIPWMRMTSPADVAAMAARARGMERAFVLSSTAPAEALGRALALFAQVPDCKRRVIDLSGDGTPNAEGGADIAPLPRQATRAGVTVNALAIEGIGVAITNFYRRAVITADGFVMTARGHRDYPRAIRAKILREISRVIG